MEKMSKNTRREAIRKGLMYLELQFDTEEFPFSSDCFGTSRDNLNYSYAQLERLGYGGLHDMFNMYVLLLFLEQHLPSNFRSKVIDKMRPNKIELVNFFNNFGGQLFPDDVETTSCFYHGLLKTNTITEIEFNSLAHSIYKNVNQDGVIHVYFVTEDIPRYNRIDAVCAINIARCAYAQRHEHLIERTVEYIFNWLNSKEYKSGTLYYPSAYTFLYFCSQLASTNYQTKIRFMDTLRREFDEINHDDVHYPLDFAFIILTGAELGVRNEMLIGKLLEMQIEDGSWPVDAFYSTNKEKSKIYFGSKSITTIFSVLALIETI